jgi:hypothetical protein
MDIMKVNFVFNSHSLITWANHTAASAAHVSFTPVQDYDRLHMMGDTWRSTVSHMMRQASVFIARARQSVQRFSKSPLR